MTDASTPPGERHDLDPRDWDAFRRDAHAMLDDLIDHVASVRERPVWRRPADASVEAFRQPLPRTSRALDGILDDVRRDILPFTTGNIHPRFMGWVHGAGTPVGMVAEMIAGALDMNCGGRDHIGHAVERQVARWMAEAVGYPLDASGLFVTGSSMANFLALLIAKCAAAGTATRRDGIGALPRRLVAYTSREAHACIAQAMEMAGIGSANLRRIATDASGAMDVAALERQIGTDRDAGLQPFLLVGTAGTVNTGAIDPLSAIAAIAAREQVWFHVDGAIGALACLSRELAPKFAGIEASQSIAFDFHKWGQVPYDAGFLLVRDPVAHKQAFVGEAAYLQRSARGLAAGETWPCDLGPDLSRGFRSLKAWMTIAAHGADRMGAAMAANCAVARHLAARIAAEPRLELKAPVALNIVCFGARSAADGAINRDIVMDLQEAGIAAPSWTTIDGQSVIRCAIVNHRTTEADVDAMLEAVLARLAARQTAPG